MGGRGRRHSKLVFKFKPLPALLTLEITHDDDGGRGCDPALNQGRVRDWTEEGCVDGSAQAQPCPAPCPASACCVLQAALWA